MPRKPRIEYAGAVYHVMSRGDRCGKIFLDRLDYELFMGTTSEVCRRCGWHLHAYVLMPNHYHWLLETPEANLIAGMKWFLGAYSQRFNNRHGQRGHVFQGRYKALPVEADSGNYFEVLSTYIHLNPVRAGLLPRDESRLGQYRWSSFPHYLSTANRPSWLMTRRVLGNMGLKDRPKGRKDYGNYLARRMQELRTKKGRESAQGEWRELRHAWYLGGEEFRDRLLGKIAQTVEEHERESYSGPAVVQHDEKEAERLLKVGMRALKVSEGDLQVLRKGDELKCALAWLVHSRTMAGNKWISDRLAMGRPSNLPERIKKARNPETQRMQKIIRTLAKITK